MTGHRKHRDATHPAYARLREQLDTLNLDPAAALDLTAWMLGLRANMVPEIEAINPSEADVVAERIKAHWYTLALKDEWEAARERERKMDADATAQGEAWLR